MVAKLWGVVSGPETDNGDATKGTLDVDALFSSICSLKDLHRWNNMSRSRSTLQLRHSSKRRFFLGVNELSTAARANSGGQLLTGVSGTWLAVWCSGSSVSTPSSPTMKLISPMSDMSNNDSSSIPSSVIATVGAIGGMPVSITRSSSFDTSSTSLAKSICLLLWFHTSEGGGSCRWHWGRMDKFHIF